MFGAIATGIFASSTVQAAYSGPPRRQPAAGRHPGRRRRRDDRATRPSARSSSSRSSTSCSASGSSPRSRRWGSTCPSTARPPIRCDDQGAGSPAPTSQVHHRAGRLSTRSSTAAGSSHLRRTGHGTSKRPRQRRAAAPLYEARFEHDACGVGFVADAGGRSRDRVLPLALAGLAALGHRGAFGADGESSDGAGVVAAARPVAPRAARPATPRPRRGRASSRSSCRAAGAPSGGPGRSSRRRSPRRACRSLAWRDGPGRCSPRSGRRRPRPGRPSRRPSWRGRRRGRRTTRGRSRDDAFERRLVVARRRLESAAPARRRRAWPSSRSRPLRPGRSSTRASSSAAACPTSTRTCARRCRVALRGLPPALRDEHPPGLAARPAVPVDRPQRRDQHGPRQPRAGPRPGRGRRRLERSRGTLLAAGPLLSAGRLRLALARRGPRAADGDRLGARRRRCSTAIPEALAPAPRDRIRSVATLRAPDGRLPRAVGRPGGASSSPTAGGSARWSTGTACARRAFAVTARPARGRRLRGRAPCRSRAAETVRRGRLGPGRAAPRRAAAAARILEDAEAKAAGAACAADP